MRHWLVQSCCALLMLAGLTLAAHSPGVAAAPLAGTPPAPLAGMPVAPAQPSTDPPPPNFRRIGLGDGPAYPTINSIAQDDFGWLWLGTPDGLVRFDGYEFRSARPGMDAPPCTRSARAVFVDSRNRVWSGSQGRGACVYDPTTATWRAFLDPDPSAATPGPVSVRDFAEDAAGTVWLVSNLGLAYLPPGADQFTAVLHPGDAAAGPDRYNPVALAYQPDRGQAGTLWIAAYGGSLDAFDLRTQQFTHYHGDTPEAPLLSSALPVDLTVDRSGRVWVATWDGGLNRFDPQTGQVAVYRANPNNPDAISSDQVMKVIQDSAGRMWVATYGGGINLLDVQTGRFTHYRAGAADPRSLSQDNVVALYADRTGLLWIGTEGGGANALNLYPQPFRQLRRNPDDPNQIGPGLVTAIAEAETGRLWVGSSSGGLALLERDGAGVRRFTTDPDDSRTVSTNSIGALLRDNAGRLWVGTSNGLDRFDAANDTFVHYVADPADPLRLRSGAVSALALDRDGALWVGTFGGLSRLDPARDSFTHYVHDDQDPASLSANDVRTLLMGAGNDLWVGVQNGGLNRLDRATGRVTRYRFDPTNPAGLSGNNVTALALDGQGMLWVGTSEDGLNRLDPATGQVTRYGPASGLPHERIKGLLFVPGLAASTGQLWVSTGRGLARLDLQTERFMTFDTADGLFDSGFTDYAATRGADGTLLFGAPDGILTFDPAQVFDSTTAPQVELTDFLINNQPATIGPGGLLPTAIFAGQAVTLPADVRAFSIGFAAPGQWNPAEVRYRYRLEGYDRDWIEAGTGQRLATYTNLNPAHYSFAVQAAGRNGVWSDPPRIVAVGLAPAWWETWWLRLTAGLAAVALVALAVVSTNEAQLRRSRKRNRELEAQVAERTNELSALLDISKSITSERDLDPLVQRVLKDMATALPHTGSVALLCDRVNGSLRAYRRVGDTASSREVPLAEEALGTLTGMAQPGQPFTLDGPAAQPGRDPAQGMEPSPELNGVAADLLPATPPGAQWLGAPLLARDEVMGLLLVYAEAPRRLTAEDAPSLQRFANQIAIAADNARLYARLQQVAVAVERNRLSRELHDTVSQYLHSIGLHADAADRALGLGKLDAGRTNIQQAQHLAQEAIDELRTLIADLRLTALQDHGLAYALQSHISTVNARNDLHVTLDAHYPQRLPAETEFELYRIAQEAITNAVKHAGATEITVTLHANGATATSPGAGGPAHTATLAVSDNGTGFDVAAARRRGTYGLSSLDERTQKIGGRLAICSDSEHGTTVHVEVHE